jgi:hypothetical protein
VSGSHLLTLVCERSAGGAGEFREKHFNSWGASLALTLLLVFFALAQPGSSAQSGCGGDAVGAAVTSESMRLESKSYVRRPAKLESGSPNGVR